MEYAFFLKLLNRMHTATDASGSKGFELIWTDLLPIDPESMLKIFTRIVNIGTVNLNPTTNSNTEFTNCFF